jgi:DNA-binding MarR family transcriptional regulator
MLSADSQDGRPGSAPGASVERFVSALLRWGSRPEVRRAMLPEGVGLSTTDDWLLRRVRDVGPVRLSELAAWQGVDRSTMTSQARHLEELGLVERRPDPADRRAVLVQVTSAGRRVQDDSVARARVVLDGLVADWSADDRADLARLLDRVVERLEEPPASG